ncbi:MAG: PAS domain S-box protein [Rhodospirillaceae bacterium]|nr:PAS domain S-box protein [Rhodospirillales bacterium]
MDFRGDMMSARTEPADETAALIKQRVTSLLGALLAAALIIGVTARIELYERERFQHEARVNAIRHASVLRARLEGALNGRLHLAHGLAAYARSHPNELIDFASFAEGLTATGIAGIRSLQLAPQAVVRYVYPLKGNESVIGHDLLKDPARRIAVLRTIDERLFVIAGPVPLLQGGNGLIARYPLFLGEAGKDTFWGFATVVLNLEPILAEGGLEPSVDPGYVAALRGKDAQGPLGAQFFGETRVFDESPVLLDILLPHGTWQLAVIPAKGWPTSGPYSPVIWLAGILLALLGALVTFSRLYAPAKLRMEVTRAVGALRESEEQFRRVAESATDAMVSSDEQGAVVFWNRAAEKIFQYSPEEAMGQPVTELVVPPQYREGHTRELFLNDIEEGRRFGKVTSTIAMRKDGSLFPAELTLSTWTFRGQIYFTAIIRDISERKAAEREQALLKERFFQSQKMEAIGTLASGAAHEFNNILNGLLANAEKAASELPTESPAMATLYEVMDAGWRAAEIVRQLLVFSERQADCDTLLSPVAALQQLLPRIESSLPEQLRLETNIQPCDQQLAIEHDQFCHLVWNLCMNAVKAMLPDPGTLTITMSTQTDAGSTDPTPADEEETTVRLALGHLDPGPHLRLAVSDSGRGMDGETLARAFDPFFTTSEVGGGSGLGLPVALGIIQSHSGGIVVSTRKGAGTTFEVFLPLVAKAE